VGIRVIAKLQASVLKLLHEGHVGMVKMKMLARSYIWWPCIDKEIEDIVKSCRSCQEVQKVLRQPHYTLAYGHVNHGS